MGYGVSIARTLRSHANDNFLYNWYNGPVADAPQLPPQILESEVVSACAYAEHCLANVNNANAYMYAPGGAKYQKLLRESEGVSSRGAWSSTSIPCVTATDPMSARAFASTRAERTSMQKCATA